MLAAAYQGWIDVFEEFVEDPTKAARRVAQRRPLSLGIACYVAGGLGFFLARAATSQLLLLPPNFGGALVSVSFHLVSAVLICSMFHLFLSLGGEHGSAAGLFILLGLCDLVWCLAVPAVIAYAAVPSDATRGALGLILVALFLSNLYLKARSIKDLYVVSFLKAYVVLFLPYMLFGMLISVLLGWGVIALVASIWKLVG